MMIVNVSDFRSGSHLQVIRIGLRHFQGLFFLKFENPQIYLQIALLLKMVLEMVKYYDLLAVFEKTNAELDVDL